MKASLIITLLALLPSFIWAKTISTPGKAIVVGGSDIGKRVCYYEDKAYSKGAILKIGERYIICKEINDFETNGPLGWQEMTADQQN